MNFDLLLTWMSHLASGSWTSFRQALQELLPEDADVSDAARQARVVLSDLGFADFFVDGSDRWKILPSLIGGLGRPEVFSLVGARSPALVRALEAAATAQGARVEVRALEQRPASIEVSCNNGTAMEIADEVQIGFTQSLANSSISAFSPIRSLLDAAPCEPPKNWPIRSFDLQTLQWVESLLPKSACEFTSRFGERQYFVHLGRKKFMPAGKRESVFISAAIKGHRLVKFDDRQSELCVPLAAPIPEALARAACLCSGALAVVRDGHFIYSFVPHSVAYAILAALGQPVMAVHTADAAECANG